MSSKSWETTKTASFYRLGCVIGSGDEAKEIYPRRLEAKDGGRKYAKEDDVGQNILRTVVAKQRSCGHKTVAQHYLAHEIYKELTHGEKIIHDTDLRSGKGIAIETDRCQPNLCS